MKHRLLYMDTQSWGGISKQSRCETGIFVFDEDVSWLNEYGEFGPKKFNKDGLEIIIYKGSSEISRYGEDLIGEYTFKEILDFFAGFAIDKKICSIEFGHYISIISENKIEAARIYKIEQIESIVERRKYYILL